MGIPANITTELNFLEGQVTANTPLTGAPRATITAMQLNAAQLVNDIDSAVTNAAGTLDTWTPPTDPAAIAAGLEALGGNADDQSALTNMRGFVGRAAANLAQLP
jgi:hypothetical protein